MSRSADHDIPVEWLRGMLAYDVGTAALVWRERPRDLFASEQEWREWNVRYAGKSASVSGGEGYLQVVLNFGGRRRGLRAHRVVFALATGAWPQNEIDHIDHRKADNRLANLRDVTSREHAQNQTLRKGVERGEAFRVLLTVKEKQELQEAADQASLPLAIYLRIAGLEKARETKPAPK